MARRSTRREGLDHRRRETTSATSVKSYSHVLLHCFLSPTLLVVCIFLISFSTKIVDGMSAVYSLSGVVDGVPSAESGSGENIAPSAGPTPHLVADETTSKGPHVPWQVMKGDDSQIEVTDSTSAGKNRNKSAVVRPAEMPARIPEPKELKNTLLNSKSWRDSASLLEMRKKSSLSKQSESANRGSKSSFKNTGTTEEVSSGVMSDFESEEEHKKYNEANLRPVEGNKQLHAEKVEERKPANLKTVHASVLQRPLGALVGGKVGDFMGSHLEDGSSMVRGQNITRLSYALYKVVRLFNLKRLIDFPAGAHVGWMPEMVTRFEYDIPGFVYEGLDTTDDRLDSAKVAADLYGNAEFRVANPEVDIPVDSGDMLLVWNELDGERSDPRSAEYATYIINVVKAAKKANIAYITFGQYPRLRGVAPIYSKGRWRFIGKSKEEPFLFNEHVRGVVPMASGAGGYHLHMTLFSLRSLTEEALTM